MGGKALKGDKKKMAKIWDKNVKQSREMHLCDWEEQYGDSDEDPAPATLSMEYVFKCACCDIDCPFGKSEVEQNEQRARKQTRKQNNMRSNTL